MCVYKKTFRTSHKPFTTAHTHSKDWILVVFSSLFLQKPKIFPLEQRCGLHYLRCDFPQEPTGCHPISDAVVTRVIVGSLTGTLTGDTFNQNVLLLVVLSLGAESKREGEDQGRLRIGVLKGPGIIWDWWVLRGWHASAGIPRRERKDRSRSGGLDLHVLIVWKRLFVLDLFWRPLIGGIPASIPAAFGRSGHY